jgi:RNA polymerase sigma-70 factor (ECF subfamily)
VIPGFPRHSAPRYRLNRCKEAHESSDADLDLALFISRDKLDADRFDVLPNNEGPSCDPGTYASNAAYYASQDTAGNKYSGGTLSSRQRLAGSPLRLVSGRDPVSARFGDQLIAVLPRLRRFARGLSGSVADADDLVQAACERALARQHQFQEGTRFDSWMFRIVQTIWIDQIRSRDVRKEDGDIAEDRLGSDEPVRRVEARLALAEVRRALDRLPPDQRAALLLVTVEGLSYKEAAEVVQVPVGTIMSRLSRARIALQLQLEAGREGRRSTSDAAAQ